MGMDYGPSRAYLECHDPEPADEARAPVTTAQNLADRLTGFVGSWPFILTQSATILLWILLNFYLLSRPWDPYPFILLNLMLSFQAAYTGPIVLMSQKRMAEYDRETAQRDYHVDKRAEQEIEVIMQHLVHHDRVLARIEEQLSQIRSPR